VDCGGRVRVSSTSDTLIRYGVDDGRIDRRDHDRDGDIHRWWTVMGV
jgi:hypothetical protein